ncbi:host cell division inhibitor Icd-like protein [Salmonella enterica subsp. enterica]|nr:host cell division inhibitor Icd-like protein [Salmonella enterica subsp. enterica]
MAKQKCTAICCDQPQSTQCPNPVMLRITADNEALSAAQTAPDYVLSFAARIPLRR